MPGIAVTCEAEIHVRGASGPRVIRAADFVLAPLTTALAPDELIVELAPAALARRKYSSARTAAESRRPASIRRDTFGSDLSSAFMSRVADTRRAAGITSQSALQAHQDRELASLVWLARKCQVLD